MDRLTIKRKLPPKGQFMEVSKSEITQVNDASPEDVYRKLQAYEDTGYTPEEIKALREDNEKLHRLLDEIEEIVLQKGGE